MDVERGCLVPLAQSVVSGILAGLLALAVGLWQGWEGAGYIAFVVGSAASVVVWVNGLTSWRRAAFPAPVEYAEVTTGPAPKVVKVEVKRGDEEGHRTQIADLPVSHDQLVTLAVGLLSGVPMAESTWTGFGKPFTRGEFAELRAEFIKRGWAAWRNDRAPAQGVVLSAPGRAVMRSFASELTLPHRLTDVSK